MNLTLLDGTIFSPLTAMGGSSFVHGQSRDCLSFVFPADMDMAALDAAFTAENCGSIVLEDESGNQYVHKGYTIRAELKKEPVVVSQGDSETPEVTEMRVTIKMAQATYMEGQLASLQEAVELLVMESLL